MNKIIPFLKKYTELLHIICEFSWKSPANDSIFFGTSNPLSMLPNSLVLDKLLFSSSPGSNTIRESILNPFMFLPPKISICLSFI